jgi:hypothetical protein
MSTANPLSAHAVLRREWRQLGRLVFESAVTGLVVSIMLALAVFIVSFEAQAAGCDPGRGALLFRGAGDAQTAAPLLLTNVPMDVAGFDHPPLGDDHGNASDPCASIYGRGADGWGARQ